MVVPPAELSEAQRSRMLALLAAYFENVDRRQFDHDLAEKEWVVILSDAATGVIQGFSTLMRVQCQANGEPVVAFFSGDTIIDRDYWGEAELPRIWGRHVFHLADQIRPTRAYWFLISSGYKTYRFLSVFFREFYPTYRTPTPPAVKRVLDVVALAKFPNEYDASSGTIRFHHASPLREGVAEVSPQRLKDPDIAFFVQANPGYAQGEQLACLVELRRDNLTPAGRRMLGEG
jgi:hypothetical protein